MFDRDYVREQFQNLLNIDSTTSQFREIQEYVAGELKRLGCSVSLLNKGGVIAEFGGEGDPLVVAAHLDDIGLMVRHINADGTLNVCSVGGLYPFYCVTENVRIYTRDGKVYTGTVCRTPNSIHVTEDELRKTLPDFRTNVCVVLDQDVKNADDVRKLGIDTGDIIALDHRQQPRLRAHPLGRIGEHLQVAACLSRTVKSVFLSKTPSADGVFSCFSVHSPI